MTAANGTAVHIEPLSDRDVRALTECMSTLSDVGVIDGADAFYRHPKGGCKHVRRVRFATGRRSIPEWVNDDAVDDQLGLHVETV